MPVLRRAFVVPCLLLVLFAARTAHGQGTGFAGTNWFETQTPQDALWIADMVPPGGSFTLRYRADKYDTALPPNLADVIALGTDLAAAGKGLRVVYTASMTATPAINLQGVQTLVAGGVDVIAVEAGNEEYAPANFGFDFAAYQTAFEPIYLAIAAEYPTLPFSIFLAPRPADSDGDGIAIGDPDDILGGNGNHQTFNDAAVAFLATADPAYAVSVHWYFNANEAPISSPEPAGRAFDLGVYDADLDAYYQTLYQQGAASTLWEKSLAYLARVVPTRAAYITEFGFSNAASLKNTLGYSMTMWRVWNTWRASVAESLMFNGISASGAGMIFPASSKDLNPGGFVNLRRLDYWLYYLLARVPVGTPELPPTATLATPGTLRYWFTNPGEAFTPAWTLAGVEVRSATVHYVRGQYWYSSAGVCEWMNNASVPSFEIGGTQTTVVSGMLPEIPRLAFGYVELELDEPTDAYVVYAVKTPATDAGGLSIPANDFPSDWVLTLDDLHLDDADPDDPESFLVVEPRTLLAPAALGAAAAPAFPGRHSVGYQTKQGRESFDGTTPPFARPAHHVPRVWQLTNQLGTIAVSSKKLASLTVPATASSGAPPVAAADATHRACYAVKVTKDVTAQTPETAPGSGVGAFDSDLQVFFRDAFFDDCALGADGTPSFAGTSVEGRCLVTLGKPALLCNPIDTAAVVPPRLTSAVIDPSTADTRTSLLCYKTKLAKTFTYAPAAALAGVALDAAVQPAQRVHVKRKVGAGTGVYVGVGNQFPGPAQLDTTKTALLCLPTTVVSVAPLP